MEWYWTLLIIFFSINLSISLFFASFCIVFLTCFWCCQLCCQRNPLTLRRYFTTKEKHMRIFTKFDENDQPIPMTLDERKKKLFEKDCKEYIQTMFVFCAITLICIQIIIVTILGFGLCCFVGLLLTIGVWRLLKNWRDKSNKVLKDVSEENKALIVLEENEFFDKEFQNRKYKEKVRISHLKKFGKDKLITFSNINKSGGMKIWNYKNNDLTYEVEIPHDEKASNNMHFRRYVINPHVINDKNIAISSINVDGNYLMVYNNDKKEFVCKVEGHHSVYNLNKNVCIFVCVNKSDNKTLISTVQVELVDINSFKAFQVMYFDCISFFNLKILSNTEFVVSYVEKGKDSSEVKIDLEKVDVKIDPEEVKKTKKDVDVELIEIDEKTKPQSDFQTLPVVPVVPVVPAVIPPYELRRRNNELYNEVLKTTNFNVVVKKYKVSKTSKSFKLQKLLPGGKPSTFLPQPPSKDMSNIPETNIKEDEKEKDDEKEENIKSVNLQAVCVEKRERLLLHNRKNDVLFGNHFTNVQLHLKNNRNYSNNGNFCVVTLSKVDILVKFCANTIYFNFRKNCEKETLLFELDRIGSNFILSRIEICVKKVNRKQFAFCKKWSHGGWNQYQRCSVKIFEIEKKEFIFKKNDESIYANFLSLSSRHYVTICIKDDKFYFKVRNTSKLPFEETLIDYGANIKNSSRYQPKKWNNGLDCLKEINSHSFLYIDEHSSDNRIMFYVVDIIKKTKTLVYDNCRHSYGSFLYAMLDNGKMAIVSQSRIVIWRLKDYTDLKILMIFIWKQLGLPLEILRHEVMKFVC